MSHDALLPNTVIAIPLLDPAYRRWLSDTYNGRRDKLPPPPSNPYGPVGHLFDDDGTDRNPLPVIFELLGHDENEWQRAFSRLGALLHNYSQANAERIAPNFVSSMLNFSALAQLIAIDQGGISDRSIESVWPDFPIQPLMYEGYDASQNCLRSLTTISAASVWQYLGAGGEDIVWAVMDSGIAGKHEHFQTYDTLGRDVQHLHRDFTAGASPLTDEIGHGTQVAGIISGSLIAHAHTLSPFPVAGQPLNGYGVYISERDEGFSRTDVSVALQAQMGAASNPAVGRRLREVSGIPAAALRGVAPQCKLVSLKVFGADDPQLLSLEQRTSRVIAAITYLIDDVNRAELVVHGVNLSLGYEFLPYWQGCGQTPLCKSINRLQESGVIVVAAAGNTGSGSLLSNAGTTHGGIGISINDPGNASGAITVGSTYFVDPWLHGVSHFSSKGPTVDGRSKPDLLAPGERVVSCTVGQKLDDAPASRWDHEWANYIELSGTSMAAPHVSGAIAAFLSLHRQHIGKPKAVKQIFQQAAEPLGRDPYFEGRGLLDLQRAIKNG